MNKITARSLLALIGIVLTALSALIVWWFPLVCIGASLFYWLLIYLIDKATS